jgi:hypothetical protein
MKHLIEYRHLICSCLLACICCHGDLEIVGNLTHCLILLLFDRTLNLLTLTEQEYQQQTFAVDSLLAKK